METSCSPVTAGRTAAGGLLESSGCAHALPGAGPPEHTHKITKEIKIRRIMAFISSSLE
jgi:hypothetical protein